MSINTKTTKTQDSKFLVENIHPDVKKALVTHDKDGKSKGLSFSVAQSLDPNPKIIELYTNKLNDPKLKSSKNKFLKDDQINLKRKNYHRLFYKTSNCCTELDDLLYDPKSDAPPKTVIIIEQDECYINHVKTIAAVIQFCLTLLTYVLNEKMKDHQQFVLSDLKYIPGFILNVLDNGIIDVENSYFINHVTGKRIDCDEPLFNFNFKMLIEGYSSPDTKCRQLKGEFKKHRDDLVNDYLEKDEDKLSFWQFPVLTKPGARSSHTVELRPVVEFRHISTINDLLQLIYDFHFTQGIIYNFVGYNTGSVCNAEHGNSKNPAYKIGNAYYEICYLINEEGFPVVIDYEDRENFDFDEHKHKFVTESRHYGSDVECTFNGLNTTFGNGNKFDIMLKK